MPNKDKMSELINKWDWMLAELGKAKYKLYKYSKIYENISSQTKNPNELKFLLPLMYRIFKNKSDINVSRSKKNSFVVLETDKNEINHMDLDGYMSFLDAVSEIILEKLIEESISSIYRIKLEEENAQYVLSIDY